MIRNILTAVLLLAVCSLGRTQAPEAFNYQAVVRDISGSIIASQPIGMQVSILQTTINGTAVYVETHSVNTNGYGLINVQIGTGVVQSGAMSTIDWGADLYFIKVEVDPAGGTNYQISSTAQLVSVPYALYAKESGSNFSGDYNDLVNVPTDISTFNNDVGYVVTEVDGDVSNELQNLTLVGTTLTLSNGGGSVVLPTSLDNDPTNEYVTGFSLAGSILTLTDGGGSFDVDLSGLGGGSGDPDQTLSIVGNNLTISGAGNTVAIDGSTTNELITNATLAGTDLQITDAGAMWTVDLSSLVGGGDPSSTNELITNATLVGTDLQITDAGATWTVDLSSLGGGGGDPDQTLSVVGNNLTISGAGNTVGIDGSTTNELITNATLNGTDLEITDAGATWTVDLSSLVGGGDPSSTNELITNATLVGTDLQITDAGATWTVDLSGLSGGGGSFRVGQMYEGGVIFYVDSSGQHGLIAALADLAGTYPWRDATTGVVAGAQSLTDGAANTAAIVAYMVGAGGTAANAADSHVSGGQSDWYLPSVLELQLLFQAAYVIPGITIEPPNGVYWSSTEAATSFGFQAFEQDFFGVKASQNKTQARKVRPIRAF